MAELIDHTNRTLVAVNSRRGATIPRAIHIPRPYKKKLKRSAPKAVKAVMAKRGIPVIRRKKEK